MTDNDQKLSRLASETVDSVILEVMRQLREMGPKDFAWAHLGQMSATLGRSRELDHWVDLHVDAFNDGQLDLKTLFMSCIHLGVLIGRRTRQ